MSAPKPQLCCADRFAPQWSAPSKQDSWHDEEARASQSLMRDCTEGTLVVDTIDRRAPE